MKIEEVFSFADLKAQERMAGALDLEANPHVAHDMSHCLVRFFQNEHTFGAFVTLVGMDT